MKHSLGASALLAFSAAVPAFLNRTAQAAAARPNGRDSVLVVLQLSGGNDGLNTVIPYEDDAYHRQRPTLHVTANRVHRLGSGLGLHPDMPAFLRLYQEGHLSILQGVGYPNSNRDHEAAMRHWHTAAPEQEFLPRKQKAAAPSRTAATNPVQARQSRSRGLELNQTGWLGRAIDQAYGPADLPGAFVGPIQVPFGLQAERAV
ncbi:MAG TPA: hypothetical protein VNZ22_15760, partial [Bacillota bacterium]|nr:hypothetical protein [Bacillota bacterium]